MKVLICGSREWPDPVVIQDRIIELPDNTIIIQGAARGGDSLGKHYAWKRGLFVADMICAEPHWRRYGRSAGHKRNAAMLDLEPDLVIAFQHNDSRGTQGTIDEARRRGIPVEVYTSGDQ